MVYFEQYDCTPATVEALQPCVDCFSDSQLEIQAIIMLDAFINVGSYDLSGLLDESKCYTCLGKKQQKAAIVKILTDYFQSFISAADAQERRKCLECISPGQRRAILVRLICEFIGKQSVLL